MVKPFVHVLDLNFQGNPNTICVYLVPHSKGGILVECGPRSTIPNLIDRLSTHNLAPENITDVLLTHIHLDHAGSAGWWANRHNATIHVHNVGAPHLINPEKLIASATRIYSEQMEILWGEIIAIPKGNINILHDNDNIQINERLFRALDTPGHANHHMSYLLDGICFSGDVGGVHIPGQNAVRLPTVPPEFDIGKWRYSIKRLRYEQIDTFATTHFGLHEDAEWHLSAIEQQLDEIEMWMEAVMGGNPSKEEFRNDFRHWLQRKANEAGLNPEMIVAYDSAISSKMSADGIFRYWQKSR
jgi:glyoxylase-like metal-dependent hydrolase (beta-lactamase superfamily II)